MVQSDLFFFFLLKVENEEVGIAHSTIYFSATSDFLIHRRLTKPAP